jgi:hypothetical protein
MKTHADRIAELEAESARRAEGKCFVQLMYEFYTGGFRPVRPAAKVLHIPDPLGEKSERLEAWARAEKLAQDMARQREAEAHGQR